MAVCAAALWWADEARTRRRLGSYHSGRIGCSNTRAAVGVATQGRGRAVAVVVRSCGEKKLQINYLYVLRSPKLTWPIDKKAFGWQHLMKINVTKSLGQ